MYTHVHPYSWHTYVHEQHTYARTPSTHVSTCDVCGFSCFVNCCRDIVAPYPRGFAFQSGQMWNLKGERCFEKSSSTPQANIYVGICSASLRPQDRCTVSKGLRFLNLADVESPPGAGMSFHASTFSPEVLHPGCLWI